MARANRTTISVRPLFSTHAAATRGRHARAVGAYSAHAAARRAGDMRAALLDKTNVFITKNQEARRNLGPRACAPTDRSLGLPREIPRCREKESASERASDREASSHPPFTPVARSPTVHQRTTTSQPIPTISPYTSRRQRRSWRESHARFSSSLLVLPLRFPSGPRSRGGGWGVVGRVEVSGASRCADVELGFSAVPRESLFFDSSCRATVWLSVSFSLSFRRNRNRGTLPVQTREHVSFSFLISLVIL